MIQIGIGVAVAVVLVMFFSLARSAGMTRGWLGWELMLGSGNIRNVKMLLQQR